MSNPESALAIPEPVKPVVSAEQAKKGWEEFERLKDALLTSDDYQPIGDKKFIKRSGFRKIGVCFNLSDRIVEQVRTDREDGTFFWRIGVEVAAPNGRVVAGVGICDSAERKFAHLEHDVYATAHTRAKNRAISDMVAGGAVSAEEMESSTANVERPYYIDREAVLNAVEDSGLDTSVLNVYPENGTVIVQPAQYLDKAWSKYNDVLVGKLGATWRSAGKASRWVIQVA